MNVWSSFRSKVSSVLVTTITTFTLTILLQEETLTLCFRLSIYTVFGTFRIHWTNHVDKLLPRTYRFTDPGLSCQTLLIDDWWTTSRKTGVTCTVPVSIRVQWKLDLPSLIFSPPRLTCPEGILIMGNFYKYSSIDKISHFRYLWTDILGRGPLYLLCQIRTSVTSWNTLSQEGSLSKGREMRTGDFTDVPVDSSSRCLYRVKHFFRSFTIKDP